LYEEPIIRDGVRIIQTTKTYIGSELDLFEEARRWKQYLSNILKPYIYGHVLEVGAGKGSTTSFLLNNKVKSWCCLEPDPKLCEEIEYKIEVGALPSKCNAFCGLISDIPAEKYFDVIIYIDVLEHIANDKAEVVLAGLHVQKEGNLIILAPAHNVLYSPFDKAIGHFRRYNRSSLSDLKPEGFTRHACRYLDSVGLLASLSNKLVFSSAMPTLNQVLFWDRCLVPVSIILDRLLNYKLGKSLVSVWSNK